jgi:5-methylcytosine-specific restriction endonuclease McrA
MSKKPSRKTIITKLDNIFSQYIRLRYSKNEISECVTCGKQDHWKKLQAGHFISRKHYATRWDEDNVQVQCSGCNVFRYGEQYLFSKYLGVDLSEELLIKSRKIQKFSDNELLEMIELYTEKVNNLLI